MNLNKLFHQFKIRKKLTIAFTALAVVPMSLTGLFGLIYTIRVLETNSLQQLESSISTMQVKVERFLNEAQSDIFYLRDSHVFRQFINSLSSNNDVKSNEWKHVVEQQFRDFAANRRIYYQLRFLDRSATEVFRIEYESNHAVVIPEERLTRRQDVFYLYYAENRVTRELLYTPVELRSATRPETIVPAISYFVPVYNNTNDNRLQGILVANVYAQKLFDILKEQPLSQGRRTLLADKNGYYVFNSEKQEWNKLLALRKEGNIGQDFPEFVSTQILSGKRGLIDKRLDEIIAYAPIFFSGSPDNFLVLVNGISRDLIHQPIETFTKAVLIFGAFIFGAALLLGFLGANQFTKPIKALSKGSEMLALGNLDYRIKIETNDEIEQLANDFNQMAGDLKDHEIQLKNYAEELENKVKERTWELSEALSYLRNLIDSSIDAIITLNNERAITFFSRGAEAILGYREQDMLGKKICSFCESCTMETCAIVGVTENRTKLQSHEIDFKNRRGETVPLNMSASPIKNDAGEVIGILTISKDMTVQKRMEQQVQQAEKLAGIGQLAAGLAHQLNTPLAAIILSAQMMQDLIHDEDILDDINSIEYQADHCKKLIQDLLSFSRAPQKQKTRLDLVDTARVALRLMEKEFEARNIRILADFDTPGTDIYGNRNQMEQLFFNLFSNACDAMSGGGDMTIKVSREIKDQIEIVIKDTGTGIGRPILKKIFDPFFTTKDAGEGTGLGLSVCYGIVEQHGGSIEVGSKVGAGTTFTIKLPSLS